MGLKKEWAITTADGSIHTINRKGSWALIDGLKVGLFSYMTMNFMWVGVHVVWLSLVENVI